LITIIDIRRKIMWHNRSSNYTTSHKKEETKMEETRDVEDEAVEGEYVDTKDVESKETLWTKVRKNWKKILIGAGVVGAGIATTAVVVSKIRSGESEAVVDDDNWIDTSEEDTDSALETEETTETEPFAESTEVVNQ